MGGIGSTDVGGDVTTTVTPRPTRRWARRLVFTGLVLLQLFLVVRAYWAPHMEFGFHMFSEASDWQAEVVRVTDEGERIPVTGTDADWSGYRWNELVVGRGLSAPERRRHANGGVDSQLAYLQEALDWVAAHTPDDRSTRYLEADVTFWRNTGPPEHTVLRSRDRVLP